MSGRLVVRGVLRGLVMALLVSMGPAWGSTPFQRGMVSITLDDGLSSQYTTARPALNARGISATYFLITQNIRGGFSGYVTVPQVQTLITEGHEIGSHTITHPDLTTLTANALEIELHDSQAWLKSQFGLLAVPSFASPYGAYNPSVLSTISKSYDSHRTVSGGQNFKDSNILQLRSYDVHAGVTLDTVRSWIDAAAADGSWLILTFHQIVTGTASTSTEYGAADFAAILDAVKARNVDIVTVSEGRARMDGSTGDASGDTSVYADALGDGFVDWSYTPHNLDDRTVVRTGLASLSAELNKWNAVYLHHTSGLPASQYTSLELWVHGGTVGGQGVRLLAYDGSQKLGSVRLDTVLGHAIQAGTWQQVIVPLGSIGLSSTGTVRDLYLQDDTGTNQSTVYFDDIRLLRSSTPPPTTPPTEPPTTSAFTLYADSLHTTFKDRSWATRNLAATQLVHSGASAISFEPDSWKALLFNTTTRVDLSLYKTLSFWVHGGTTGGQVVRVLLKEDGSTELGSMRLDVALGHAIKPGVWEQVLIPLGSLGASSRLLQEIYFQDQSGKDQGTLFLDDIQLLP
ncbi:polysaccharide deacetylase [Cystobacter fuscus]|uniref:Polysaccharide deacetylase n=1 Tax=Cystobacter fuscus TaxID=43 RepID=A0A250JA96_9BACT|nr:polysaccharide deacetylase family protein [Cystobacter fuscus]ATB40392.1 polysaccharide deacetylase [Cystobacter fuscus]